MTPPPSTGEVGRGHVEKPTQRHLLDHALRYDRLLRVFLMTEGKAGAEQQQNLMYLYDLSERAPPQAWLSVAQATLGRR